MNKVIDLAAVRAARRASACTFEIFGDLRRPQSTDIVSVGILGDFETAADMFQHIAEARRASGIDVQAFPAELAEEPDGRYWAEGYVSFASALALRDLCRARGFAIQAA